MGFADRSTLNQIKTIHEWEALANVKTPEAEIVTVTPNRRELRFKGMVYGRFDFLNKEERWISSWWPLVNG